MANYAWIGMSFKGRQEDLIKFAKFTIENKADYTGLFDLPYDVKLAKDLLDKGEGKCKEDKGVFYTFYECDKNNIKIDRKLYDIAKNVFYDALDKFNLRTALQYVNNELYNEWDFDLAYNSDLEENAQDYLKDLENKSDLNAMDSFEAYMDWKWDAPIDFLYKLLERTHLDLTIAVEEGGCEIYEETIFDWEREEGTNKVLADTLSSSTFKYTRYTFQSEVDRCTDEEIAEHLIDDFDNYEDLKDHIETAENDEKELLRRVVSNWIDTDKWELKEDE